MDAAIKLLSLPELRKTYFLTRDEPAVVNLQFVVLEELFGEFLKGMEGKKQDVVQGELLRSAHMVLGAADPIFAAAAQAQALAAAAAQTAAAAEAAQATLRAQAPTMEVSAHVDPKKQNGAHPLGKGPGTSPGNRGPVAGKGTGTGTPMDL